MLNGQNFDFIFIDGAHDYESVRHDIALGLHSIAPGGMLCGHDYHPLGHGVIKAADEIIGHNPTIKLKSQILNTTIWFAIIDNPHYQCERLDVLDKRNQGNYEEAFALAHAMYNTYKDSHSLDLLANIRQHLP
jgi:hypothetical protein